MQFVALEILAFWEMFVISQQILSVKHKLGTWAASKSKQTSPKKLRSNWCPWLSEKGSNVLVALLHKRQKLGWERLPCSCYWLCQSRKDQSFVVQSPGSSSGELLPRTDGLEVHLPDIPWQVSTKEHCKFHTKNKEIRTVSNATYCVQFKNNNNSSRLTNTLKTRSSEEWSCFISVMNT